MSYVLTTQPDSVVVAQITYQSLFKLYPKLSGMTGTAKTEVWTSFFIQCMHLVFFVFSEYFSCTETFVLAGKGIS